MITLISLLLIIFILFFFVSEYFLLRLMVPKYFKTGGPIIKEEFNTALTMDTLVRRLEAGDLKKQWQFKRDEDELFLSYKPSFISFFIREGIPIQRIVLTFIKSKNENLFKCEIKPFYSSILLPIVIVLTLILNIVFFNPYSSIISKIVELVFVSFIGLAIYNVFRPKKDAVAIIKKQIFEQ